MGLMWTGFFIAVIIGGGGATLTYYLGEKK